MSLKVIMVSCRGATQRPVLVYLLPGSMSPPLYLTSTPIPNAVNATLHAALHSLATDNSEYFAKSGIT